MKTVSRIQNRGVSMIGKIILIIYTIISIIITQIYQISIISYVGMGIIMGFSSIVLAILFRSNTQNKTLLIIFTILSDILFSIYIVLAIKAPDATSISDLDLLPMYFFMVSGPYILVMHIILLIHIFSRNQAVVISQA